MDRGTLIKTLLLLMLALLISNVQAQTAQDLVGEWEFKMDMQGREMVSQVEFTLKEDGTLAGKWTSSGMGARAGGGTMVSELANIKFAEGKLTFDRTISFGEQAFTMSYAGTYKDGKITGGFTTEMGEIPTNGTKKTPPIVLVGEWEFVMQFGQRAGQRAGQQRVGGQQRAQRPPTKIVFAKKEDGTYTGTWAGGMFGGRGGQRGGQRAQAAGPAELTEIKLEGNKLTFVRKMMMGERDMSMNFAGTVEGDVIKGGITMALMQQGQPAMEATLTRVKPLEVLGDWEVTMTMGEREMTQTFSFTQNPDGTLAGKVVTQRGETALSEVKFEGQVLTYKQVRMRGAQEMVSTFEGKIEGDVLTGKITRGERVTEIKGKRKVKAVK